MGSTAPPQTLQPAASSLAQAPRGRRAEPASGWWLVLVVAGSLALRLWLWWRAYGFEQGDPVEYVNIAYKLAFGIGIPWWDLRPLLLSLIYVPVLLLGQLWPDPTGEAMVKMVRLVGVACATGATLLVYLIGRRLAGQVAGLFSALLVTVNPVLNALAVSTFAEVPSTFFVLLAIYLALPPPFLRGEGEPCVRGECSPFPRIEGRGRFRSLFAGLALGAACMIRYQAIAFVLPIGCWVLGAAIFDRTSRGGGRGRSDASDRPYWSAILFGLGLGAALLAQAAIETIVYGRPFHSLAVSFEYNVTSGLAPVEFGSEPFGWYALWVGQWFGFVPMILAGVGSTRLWSGPGRREWLLIGLCTATMFVFLSALPHKEVRFMSQIVPLLAIFAGAGFASIVGWVGDGVGTLGVRLLPSGAGLCAREAARDGRPTHMGARRAPLRVYGAAVVLALLSALPLLVETVRLDLDANISYVDGPKLAAEIKPGGKMGTIPWFVPRPYTGTRLQLERMDRKVWDDREHVSRVVEESDFLLFPEYWLLEDREVRRLVDARYRTIEAYENGVVLLQNRRLDESPSRRRG